MCTAPFSIHGIHPGTGTVRVGGQIKQCVPVEHHRVGYAGVVICYAFESGAGCLYSPDVPIIGAERA